MAAAKKSRWEEEDDSSGIQQRRTTRHRKKQTVGKPSTVKIAGTAESNNTAEPNSATEANNTSDNAAEPTYPPLLASLPTHLANNFSHISSCRSVDQCYERLNKIEEGTYGIVYRARDLATREIVALKHLKLDQEKNGFPVTSLREIHTLMVAKHPNIINVREIVVGKSLNSIYMVMDFMEHDLRTLMEQMREPFRPSEVKSLMWQLCSAVEHLHDNWIVHRDLKTTNLLMASGGGLRVADFGLARKYSSPLGHMTGLVVTLWYRAPELLMGEKEYSTAVDMWSVGCIFAELFVGQPLLQGRGEIDQINRIFAACGVPTETSWPGFLQLPNAKMFKFSTHKDLSKRLDRRLRAFEGMTDSAFDLLLKMLTLDPSQRITATEALSHPYFSEHPPPKDPSIVPVTCEVSDRFNYMRAGLTRKSIKAFKKSNNKDIAFMEGAIIQVKTFQLKLYKHSKSRDKQPDCPERISKVNKSQFWMLITSFTYLGGEGNAIFDQPQHIDNDPRVAEKLLLLAAKKSKNKQVTQPTHDQAQAADSSMSEDLP
ncbi:hypothetical protein H4R22_003020, partial [Coemansia sp. RSA 1290]